MYKKNVETCKLISELLYDQISDAYLSTSRLLDNMECAFVSEKYSATGIDEIIQTSRQTKLLIKYNATDLLEQTRA